MTTATTDVQDARPQTGEPLLQARGVVMRFGGLTAVDNVDLTVYEGQIVGLIGPNGAGKTTFFNCVTGIYTPTHGQVTIHPPTGMIGG